MFSCKRFDDLLIRLLVARLEADVRAANDAIGVHDVTPALVEKLQANELDIAITGPDADQPDLNSVCVSGTIW